MKSIGQLSELEFLQDVIRNSALAAEHFPLRAHFRLGYILGMMDWRIRMLQSRQSNITPVTLKESVKSRNRAEDPPPAT